MTGPLSYDTFRLEIHVRIAVSLVRRRSIQPLGTAVLCQRVERMLSTDESSEKPFSSAATTSGRHPTPVESAGRSGRDHPNPPRLAVFSDLIIRSQSRDDQDRETGGGGGDLSAQATNPTSDLTVYQIQNIFVPNTYSASGYANVLSLQVVIPIKTGNSFFPFVDYSHNASSDLDRRSRWRDPARSVE